MTDPFEEWEAAVHPDVTRNQAYARAAFAAGVASQQAEVQMWKVAHDNAIALYVDAQAEIERLTDKLSETDYYERAEHYESLYVNELNKNVRLLAVVEAAVCPKCHSRYGSRTEGSGEVRTHGEWASTGLKWIKCDHPFHGALSALEKKPER